MRLHLTLTRTHASSSSSLPNNPPKIKERSSRFKRSRKPRRSFDLCLPRVFLLLRTRPLPRALTFLAREWYVPLQGGARNQEDKGEREVQGNNSTAKSLDFFFILTSKARIVSSNPSSCAHSPQLEPLSHTPALFLSHLRAAHPCFLVEGYASTTYYLNDKDVYRREHGS